MVLNALKIAGPVLLLLEAVSGMSFKPASIGRSRSCNFGGCMSGSTENFAGYRFAVCSRVYLGLQLGALGCNSGRNLSNLASGGPHHTGTNCKHDPCCGGWLSSFSEGRAPSNEKRGQNCFHRQG